MSGFAVGVGKGGVGRLVVGGVVMGGEMAGCVATESVTTRVY